MKDRNGVELKKDDVCLDVSTKHPSIVVIDCFDGRKAWAVYSDIKLSSRPVIWFSYKAPVGPNRLEKIGELWSEEDEKIPRYNPKA
jgi:hypothetical protein